MVEYLFMSIMQSVDLTTTNAQKMKFSIKDFLIVNVTKSAVSCGFGDTH